MLDPKTSPFVIIDVETTGLKPELCRICEVGAIRLVAGKETDRFQSMIHPGIPMPPDATKINKITDDMLKEAPGFEKIAPDLRKFMAGSILVAQNAEFDVSFLNAEFIRAGMTKMAMPALDTILLARKVKPGLPTYNLDNLAYHFKVKFNERHRSIGDCEVTGQIFWQCVEALRPKTMDDLLKKGMIKA